MGCYAQNDTDIDDIEAPDNYYIAAACFHFLLFLMICVGNSLTIIAVKTTHSLQTTTNIFVVNLAVADIIVGLMIPYQQVYYIKSIGEEFMNYKYFCVFRFIGRVTAFGESLSSMTLIAFDRYVYINFPLEYHVYMTSAKIKTILVISWSYAGFMGFLLLFWNNWYCNEKCSVAHVFPEGYSVLLIMHYYTVSIFVIAMYVSIFRTALRQMRRVNVLMFPGNGRRFTRSGPTLLDIKGTKLLAIVFGVFFVCWTPHCTLILVAGLQGATKSIAIAMTFTNMLITTNSGMNILLYAWKDIKFRKAFKRILSRKISSP